MKKKFIIATASGWYWRAYNIEQDEFNDNYTTFNSREACIPHLINALHCRNVDGDVTIMEIYTLKP